LTSIDNESRQNWQSISLLSVGTVAIGFFLLFPLISVGSGTLKVDENLTNSTTPTNWTAYENRVLGISFNYPSDWEIEEKKNRFDTAADVSVTDGSITFLVIKLDNPKSELLQSLDLSDATKALEGAAGEAEGKRIIEETDVTKYQVDGERTGTFLYASNEELTDDAVQIFLVLHNGKGYNLAFTSDVFGISFDYPSTWNAAEKENRFASGADVSATDTDLEFTVSKVIDRSEDNPLKTSALSSNTRMIQEGIAKSGKDTIIEATDVKKYKVGGERAGTFVTKHDDGISPQTGVRNFIVVHDGDGYMLNFRAPTETFDYPETQNILNQLIQSFKFLN
jgi:hypothetical protein